MSGSLLDELASKYGIVSHQGFRGKRADETKVAILAAFGVDAGSREAVEAALEAARDRRPPEMRSSPGVHCHLPDRPGKFWGISAQLYELRSDRNWGIGDFDDLAVLCRIAGQAGADFVGVNPLHALFLSDAARCSPFSPSNRLFLNPLYIAVDKLPGHDTDRQRSELLQELRKADRVDYRRVAAVKIEALRASWQAWSREPPPGRPRTGFDDFRRRCGEPLARHALFEAVSADMVAKGEGSGWRSWPQEFHDPGSPAVQAFAAANETGIAFHAWLQWIADLQLGEAAEAARSAGMRIGLYLDFAVGEVPDGSASWGSDSAKVPGMRIGAPPDVFAAQGQEWGLAPPSPVGMLAGNLTGFRRAVETLARHAGALRIDHVMSLWQLFFVPEGGMPADGAYVRYPLAGQLEVLADVSRQSRTLIVGEDLGIVPPGFREVMQEARILSCRILYFERNDGAFISPEHYPVLALACLSTHDLPTLGGWWSGNDIELRFEHGLIDEPARQWQTAERARERQALIDLATRSGTLPQAIPEAERAWTADATAVPAALVVAAHRVIADTPSLLASARLADLTGETRPTNLPGTADSYPNWRLKSSVPLEELAELDMFGQVAAAMRSARPRDQGN